MKSYADGKIKVENRGAVTIVTIDRPAQRNACTVEMVKALHDAFMAFEQDETSRVAILTGSGGYFSAPILRKFPAAAPSALAGRGRIRARRDAASQNP